MGDEEMEITGAMGTSVKPPGGVLWTWQTCDLVLAVCAISAAFIGCDFMLIPLTMAYMTTYAMGPLIDVFEKRPYACPGKVLCEGTAQWTKMVPVISVHEETGEPRLDRGGNPIPIKDDNRNDVLEVSSFPGSDSFFQLDEAGNRVQDERGNDVKLSGCALDIKQLAMMAKMPHWLACILTLFGSFFILFSLVGIVASSFADFAAVEQEKVDRGEESIGDKVTTMANDFIDQLEVDGVVIIRPRICPIRNVTNTFAKTTVVDGITMDIQPGAAENTLDFFATGDDGIPKCNLVKVDAIGAPVGDAYNTQAQQQAGQYLVRTYNPVTYRCDVDFQKLVTRGKGVKYAGSTCVSPSLSYQTVARGTYGVDFAADAHKLKVCLASLETDGDLKTDYNLTEAMLGLGSLRVAVEEFAAATAALPADSTIAPVCADAFGQNLLGGMESEESPAVVLNSCNDVVDAPSGAATDSPHCDLVHEDSGLKVSTLCPGACAHHAFEGNHQGSTEHKEVCFNQTRYLVAKYTQDLESLRPSVYPADMTMAVRIYNFTETLSPDLGNCTKEHMFADKHDIAAEEARGIKRGSTWDEFMGTVGAIGAFMNDVVLVLLLAVYILLERPEGATIGGDNRVLMEIEAMIKDYINLKTILSALTGILVGIILIVTGTQLAIIFGLLSFLLNFIPSVGSMIAMLLPIPIIWLDDDISMNMKYVAICGPGVVQGYVGNALEPSLFGQSMNMTAIAVLLALVLFGFVWGLPGAVLSVPILGIIKIVCHHIDHPLAKYFLKTVREDSMYP